MIVINAGLEASVVLHKVVEGKGNFGFCPDRRVSGVVDPTKVVRFALQNAASVAGLLLTADAMVAEAPKEQDEAKTPSIPDMDY